MSDRYPRIEEFSKYEPFLQNTMSTTWLDKKHPLIKARFKELKEKIKAEKAAAAAKQTRVNEKKDDSLHKQNKKPAPSLPEITNSPLTPEGLSSSPDSPTSTRKLRKRKELSADSREHSFHEFSKPEVKNKTARTCLFQKTEGSDMPEGSPINKKARTGDGQNAHQKSHLSERFDKLKAKIQNEPIKRKVAKPAEKGKVAKPVESTKTVTDVPKSQPFKIPRGRPRKHPAPDSVCVINRNPPKNKADNVAENALPKTPVQTSATPSFMSAATKPKETGQTAAPPYFPPKSLADNVPFWQPSHASADTSLVFPAQKPVPSTEVSSPWSVSCTEVSSWGTASPLAVPLDESQPNTPIPASPTEAMEVEWTEPVSLQSEVTMDWEVNELRKEIKDSSEPSCLSTVLKSAPRVTTSYDSEVILVLDSNVLISALSFVDRMLTTPIPGLGFPVFYVPHRVLNELDGLKGCRKQEVVHHARKAILFINNKLEERHPRLSVQLLQDFIRSSHDTYLNSDDKILLCCLQAKEMGVGKRIILLSNDVNLRNKAVVEDLETFSVTDFERVIMTMTEDVRFEDLNFSMLFYKLKFLLQSVFEEILRVECKINPSKTKLTLDECIQYFVRRWQPWFCKIVTVVAEENLAQLRSVLKKDEEICLMPILNYGMAFLQCFTIRTKPYFTSVKKGLANLQLISSRAKTLVSYSPPEEKDHIGSLAEIFKICVDALEVELKKLISTPCVGADYEQRFELLGEIIKSIPAALAAILDTPLLMAEESKEISKLAGILAENSCETEDAYAMLLRNAATKEAGRDMLEKAKVMFKRAIDRCNSLLASRKALNSETPCL